MNLRSLCLALLAIPLIVSCNFHSESVCTDRPSVSLDKFLGDFDIVSADEDGEKTFQATLAPGTRPSTYTLVAMDSNEIPEAVFVDATVCQIGERVYAESKSLYDPESLTLSEMSEKEGKLIVGMLLYNQDKLEKAGVEFEDVSMEGFEGFATKVDNKNIKAEDLVKFFEVGSVLVQK